MKEGLPLPKKIAEAPELRLGLELYFQAYLDLMTARSGLGDGPISWTAIAEYAKVNEFDDEQREDLQYHVTMMDAAHTKWARSKQPKGKK